MGYFLAFPVTFLLLFFLLVITATRYYPPSHAFRFVVHWFIALFGFVQIFDDEKSCLQTERDFGWSRVGHGKKSTNERRRSHHVVRRTEHADWSSHGATGSTHFQQQVSYVKVLSHHSRLSIPVHVNGAQFVANIVAGLIVSPEIALSPGGIRVPPYNNGSSDVRWSGWVWVGECFFWYRPTRVVPDQRPLNGCVYVCVCVCGCIVPFNFSALISEWLQSASVQQATKAFFMRTRLRSQSAGNTIKRRFISSV